MAALTEALIDSEDNEASGLIRSLVQEIRLVPDGGVLRGELASILRLAGAGADGYKEAVSSAALAGAS